SMALSRTSLPPHQSPVRASHTAPANRGTDRATRAPLLQSDRPHSRKCLPSGSPPAASHAAKSQSSAALRRRSERSARAAPPASVPVRRPRGATGANRAASHRIRLRERGGRKSYETQVQYGSIETLQLFSITKKTTEPATPVRTHSQNASPP